MEKRLVTSNNKSSLCTLSFAALISLLGCISINLDTTSVPLVLQNMAVVLTGSVLGAIQGGGATGLFLLAGALGLPVFASTSGGLEHISGPTGGFLIGYFLASIFSGFIIGKTNSKEKAPIPKIITGILVGYIVIYIPGIFQFMKVENVDFFAALQICVLPFIIYDGIKFILTVILVVSLRPFIARVLRN